MLDVVMVGLGGVGSFCLRSLSKRRRLHGGSFGSGGLSQIAGIERYTRLHDRGSSHGGSRINRKAYFEGPQYVPWIQYSERVFQELSRNKNGDNDLIENCGTLIIEEPGGPLVEACSASAEEWNIPTEFLTNTELRQRYPHEFKLASDNTVGLFEPGGGFIRPERAMEAALNEAEANGAEIFEELIVDRLEEVDNHVEIHTSRVHNKSPDIVIQAKAVIIASGSWTSSLIPSWAPYLTVTRQVQAWIDVGDDDSYLPRNLSTWCMSTPHHPITLYGVPRDPLAHAATPSGWIKFGLHGRDDRVADPSSMPRLVTELERQGLWEAAKVSLHCVSGSPASSISSAKPCLYTMSPDGHFLLGRPSEYQRVVAVAGLSGHGFKMTPALGEMLCDLVLDEDFGKCIVVLQ